VQKIVENVIDWWLGSSSCLCSPSSASSSLSDYTAAFFVVPKDAAPEILHHSWQSILQSNFGFPAQELLSFGDVGFPHVGVIRRVGAVFDLCTWINHLLNYLLMIKENKLTSGPLSGVLKAWVHKYKYPHIQI
jgi:hypothetical protein